MSDMFSAEGPVPAEMVPDPTQVNGSPQPDNGQPESPDLQELVQAGALAAKAQAVKAQNADDNDAAKAHAQAFQLLCDGISKLAPPMKPIDPQLHATMRGVDPQKAIELRHQKELKQMELAHQADQAALDRQHQLEVAKSKPARSMKVQRDESGNLTGVTED